MTTTITTCAGASVVSLSWALMNGTPMATLRKAKATSAHTSMLNGPSLMIDGAKVVGADVPASNGVIHVIDAVLIPK
jgi:uncharacterized surface protein with fasciclin (FAS1) repeats